MKRRWVIALACLLLLMIPMGAQAGLDLSSYEAFKQQAAPANYFKVWLNEEGQAYAQWEKNSSKDVSFRVKVSNEFENQTVDACTFEIFARDVYDEPIRLKASDGEYCDSLYYTSERTHKPGTTGYTEYFRLKSDQRIRYVGIRLIKFHRDDGTCTIDEANRKEYIWEIK